MTAMSAPATDYADEVIKTEVIFRIGLNLYWLTLNIVILSSRHHLIIQPRSAFLVVIHLSVECHCVATAPQAVTIKKDLYFMDSFLRRAMDMAGRIGLVLLFHFHVDDKI
jgi:hypothetical protein